MSKTQFGLIVHMLVWFFIGLGINILWAVMTNQPRPLFPEYYLMLGGALSYLARRTDEGPRP